MNLKAGKYKVAFSLNISHSILSQLEESVSKKESIQKAILENSSNNIKMEQIVVYFVDGFEYGNGTEIEIIKEMRSAILFKKDYKIIKPVEYKEDKRGYLKLLNKF